MASTYDLIHRHVEAALADAAQSGIPPATVASGLLAEAVRILKEHRRVDDVRSELSFAIDNLDDRDYEFMRP
jgi:hypothetical protein